MIINRKQLIVLLLLLTATASAFAQYKRGSRSFAINGEHEVVEVDKGLSLDNAIILKNISTSSLTFTTDKNKSVSFYTYENNSDDKVLYPPANINSSTLGDNTTYTLTNLPDNRGLIINDGQLLVLWLIDYPSHRPNLNAISPIVGDDECEVLKLLIDKQDALEYRGTGGQLRQITREYELSYDILEWNEKEEKFIEKTVTEDVKNLGTELMLTRVPNKDTKFKLSGDQFGKKFNLVSEVVTSEVYKAIAVEGHIVAKQQQRDNDNEIKEGDDLGGSAPVDIEFFGRGNEPVVNFYTWFVYEKSNMNSPIARYTDQDFDYTFDQSGNYQVMLEVANAESTCVDTISVNVNITESDLQIPNFFSPGSTPGVNDEWRVAYKSLVKYKCVIFNRWGNKVFESNDPAQGWDGRYKGSMVHPGVYYYSIQATGSDGIKYNKGGDINILR